MNLQRNRLVNRIVSLSTGEPSSQTLYSTFPHCPHTGTKVQVPALKTPLDTSTPKSSISIANSWISMGLQCSSTRIHSRKNLFFFLAKKTKSLRRFYLKGESRIWNLGNLEPCKANDTVIPWNQTQVKLMSQIWNVTKSNISKYHKELHQDQRNQKYPDKFF